MSPTHRRWSAEAILAAIQHSAAEHGRPPTSSEWLVNRPPGVPSVYVVQIRFGSWANAVEAAGFPRPHLGRKIVTKQLLCAGCGEVFTSYVRTTRFCPACRAQAQERRWQKTPRERECRACGAVFRASGIGQATRQRCYECSPPSPPGQSPATLDRRRRLAREAQEMPAG